MSVLMCKKRKQCKTNYVYLHTFVTQCVGKSRFTSPFAVTSLSVTWRVIQTVTTTDVDAVFTKGSFITYYIKKICFTKEMYMYLSKLAKQEAKC